MAASSTQIDTYLLPSLLEICGLRITLHYGALHKIQ